MPSPLALARTAARAQSNRQLLVLDRAHLDFDPEQDLAGLLSCRPIEHDNVHLASVGWALDVTREVTELADEPR